MHYTFSYTISMLSLTNIISKNVCTCVYIVTIKSHPLSIEENVTSLCVLKSLLSYAETHFDFFEKGAIVHNALVYPRLKSICYEKAGDWPNKNRHFTVQN